MKNLAIIPARSGSKGLKDKNIKILNGKPLISYSIDAAIKSGCFDEVMVSTDSQHYKDIAIECGAAVPFMRSAEMSSDTATSWDTVREVLRMYREQQNKSFDSVCLLQPTSPMRTAEDILEGYRLFEEKKASTVIGVCEAEHSPIWMNTLPDNHSLDHFVSDTSGKGRQSYNTYYRINGALYIVGAAFIQKENNIYQNSYAYIMPAERSVDIDSELDFQLAEFLMSRRDG